MCVSQLVDMKILDILHSFQYTFTKTGGYLVTDLFHWLADKTPRFFLSPCQVVLLFNEKLRSLIFPSVFKMSFPKLVEILSRTHFMDWGKQNPNLLSVSFSVGSFAYWKNHRSLKEAVHTKHELFSVDCYCFKDSKSAFIF